MSKASTYEEATSNLSALSLGQSSAAVGSICWVYLLGLFVVGETKDTGTKKSIDDAGAVNALRWGPRSSIHWTTQTNWNNDTPQTAVGIAYDIVTYLHFSTTIAVATLQPQGGNEDSSIENEDSPIENGHSSIENEEPSIKLRRRDGVCSHVVAITGTAAAGAAETEMKPSHKNHTCSAKIPGQNTSKSGIFLGFSRLLLKSQETSAGPTEKPSTFSPAFSRANRKLQPLRISYYWPGFFVTFSPKTGGVLKEFG